MPVATRPYGFFLRTTQEVAAATTTRTEAAAKMYTSRCPEPPEWVDVVVEDEVVLELLEV